jgi:hypothetical protein
MTPEPSESERREPDDRAVRERLQAIAREKRGRVRWQLSHHTAEQALMAISDVVARAPYRRSSKSRRRKRMKRLL